VGCGCEEIESLQLLLQGKRAVRMRLGLSGRRQGQAWGGGRTARSAAPGRNVGQVCADGRRNGRGLGRCLPRFASDLDRRFFAGRRLLLHLDLGAESLKPLLAKIVPELAVGHAQAILAQPGRPRKFTADIAE